MFFGNSLAQGHAYLKEKESFSKLRNNIFHLKTGLSLSIIYLAHGNAFFRLLCLYVNDYNCINSCLGIYFSRLSPNYTATVHLVQRSCLNLLSLANMCQKLYQGVAQTGSMGTLPTLRCILFICPQQPVEKHIMPCLN